MGIREGYLFVNLRDAGTVLEKAGNLEGTSGSAWSGIYGFGMAEGHTLTYLSWDAALVGGVVPTRASSTQGLGIILSGIAPFRQGRSAQCVQSL